MAETAEGRVKRKVVGILKEEGVYHFAPMTHGYGRSGVPDIICCHRGRFLGIECKAGKNKLTALQALEIESIRSHGGFAIVVTDENWEMLRDYLRGKAFPSTKESKHAVSD